MKALKKENRKRRKIIESYQQMLNAGATGIYPVMTYYNILLQNV